MIMCPQAHTNYQPEKYGCVELPFILMHLCFINLFFFFSHQHSSSGLKISTVLLINKHTFIQKKKRPNLLPCLCRTASPATVLNYNMLVLTNEGIDLYTYKKKRH